MVFSIFLLLFLVLGVILLLLLRGADLILLRLHIVGLLVLLRQSLPHLTNLLGDLRQLHVRVLLPDLVPHLIAEVHERAESALGSIRILGLLRLLRRDRSRGGRLLQRGLQLLPQLGDKILHLRKSLAIGIHQLLQQLVEGIVGSLQSQSLGLLVELLQVVSNHGC